MLIVVLNYFIWWYNYTHLFHTCYGHVTQVEIRVNKDNRVHSHELATEFKPLRRVELGTGDHPRLSNGVWMVYGTMR